MNNQNYQIFNLNEIFGKYALATGKPLAYIRSYGWNNSSNVEAINTSIATYEQLLETDIVADMKDSEHIIIELERLDSIVMEYFEDNFPESQSKTAVAEQYIFYALFNEQGQLIASNE